MTVNVRLTSNKTAAPPPLAPTRRWLKAWQISADRSTSTWPPSPLPSTSAPSQTWRLTARGAAARSGVSQRKCQTRSWQTHKALLLSRRGRGGCEGRSSVSHLVKRRLRQLAGSLERRLWAQRRVQEVIQPPGWRSPQRMKMRQAKMGLFFFLPQTKPATTTEETSGLNWHILYSKWNIRHVKCHHLEILGRLLLEHGLFSS